MVPATQVKLLRVLQERTFRRLADVRSRRWTCASSRRRTSIRWKRCARASCARTSIYRLNVFAIELPPLRDRREDIPLLVQAFLNEFNMRNGKAVKEC